MGKIDLDPASNDTAQGWVKANRYFTAENCGLSKNWRGKVWLNPPYSMPLIKQFVEKLVNAERVREYVILVNNASDTIWCHWLFNDADVCCFTKGRIGFIDVNNDKKLATRQGQIFFYKGKNVEKFKKEFTQYGKVVTL